jgi:hypothetical protein
MWKKFVKNSITIYTSSNLQNYCPSYFQIMFHIQIANLQFLSRQSIPVCFHTCINLVRLDSQMLSATLSNKHTIPHLYLKFVIISHSPSFVLLYPNSSFPRISLFPSNHLSKYPRYYLCSMCDETECAMVAAFCSL